MTYGVMVIVSSIMLPLVQLLIRNYLGNKLSWSDVGIWQGLTKISDAYLVFFTSILSVYYLPKFASLYDGQQIKNEIIKGFKFFIPIHLLIIIGIYLLRDKIILILYSKDFLKIGPILIYQLIGDVFKVGSWLIGYLMWAKKMTKLLISTEIIFGLTYLLLTIFFVQLYGIAGTSIAFMVNYVVYFISVYYLIYFKIRVSYEQ
jgi:PST family polysaccharide transporter